RRVFDGPDFVGAGGGHAQVAADWAGQKPVTTVFPRPMRARSGHPDDDTKKITKMICRSELACGLLIWLLKPDLSVRKKEP
ncbi:hypothetical protein SB748_31465, partial [Rhizobium sp. SIMBA_035]